jgi:hypothetical protein
MSIWKLLYFKITLRKAKKQSFYKSETKRRRPKKFGVGSVVELF